MTTTLERLESIQLTSDALLKKFPYTFTRCKAIMIAIELEKLWHLDNIDDRLLDISSSTDAICNEIPKIYEAINNIDLKN